MKRWLRRGNGRRWLLQGPHNVLSVASSSADTLLTRVGAQLIQDVCDSPDFSLDRLLSFTPALVRLAEGSHNPELTNSSRDGEEVFNAFNLVSEVLASQVIRDNRAVRIVRVSGFPAASPCCSGRLGQWRPCWKYVPWRCERAHGMLAIFQRLSFLLGLDGVERVSSVSEHSSSGRPSMARPAKTCCK